MSEPYKLRLELVKGESRKVANLEVNSEVMDSMQGLGLNALQEAASEIVLRMQVSIEEDDRNESLD